MNRRQRNRRLQKSIFIKGRQTAAKNWFRSQKAWSLRRNPAWRARKRWHREHRTK